MEKLIFNGKFNENALLDFVKEPNTYVFWGANKINYNYQDDYNYEENERVQSLLNNNNSAIDFFSFFNFLYNKDICSYAERKQKLVEQLKLDLANGVMFADDFLKALDDNSPLLLESSVEPLLNNLITKHQDTKLVSSPILHGEYHLVPNERLKTLFQSSARLFSKSSYYDAVGYWDNYDCDDEDPDGDDREHELSDDQEVSSTVVLECANCIAPHQFDYTDVADIQYRCIYSQLLKYSEDFDVTRYGTWQIILEWVFINKQNEKKIIHAVYEVTEYEDNSDFLPQDIEIHSAVIVPEWNEDDVMLRHETPSGTVFHFMKAGVLVDKGCYVEQHYNPKHISFFVRDLDVLLNV